MQDIEDDQEMHASTSRYRGNEADEPEELTAGLWDHIIFSGASLTILFPADAHGTLCHVSRSLRVPSPGLSRRRLLAFIHDFYQVSFPCASCLFAML